MSYPEVPPDNLSLGISLSSRDVFRPNLNMSWFR